MTIKNCIASKIEWLGRKYRGFKFTVWVFISQAPFQLIFFFAYPAPVFQSAHMPVPCGYM